MWLAVIVFESTRIFGAANTFAFLYRVLRFFYSGITMLQVFYVNMLGRKFGHFLGYAIMSWFFFRGWMETLAYQKEQVLLRSGKNITVSRRWHLRAAVLAVLCTLVVASLDEFHQVFLPGRTGVFHDVILDTLGGIFAQIVLFLYWTKGKRSQRSNARAELKRQVVSS